MTVTDVLQRMRALPFRDLDTIVGDAPALILAPHPDDESLGCGGLIAAARDRGRSPEVVFITDGTGSHPHSRAFPRDRLRDTREAEANAALRELNLPDGHSTFLRLPDAAAPHDGALFDQAVGSLAAIALRRRCGCVLAPWRHDPHADHLATHRMAAVLARRLRLRHWSYPVWGWTLPTSNPLDEIVRGARLDISRHLPAKRRAIAAHVSQHGGLITDDPEGFCLPADLLSIFDESYEVYLEQDVG